MKRSILIFFQMVLLLMICVPVALADSSISISVDKTTAEVGETIVVTGKTSPDSWVPIKVVDEGKSIIFFDSGKADGKGDYVIEFLIPETAPGMLTIVVGEGRNVKTAIINGPPEEVKPNVSGGGGGGGGIVSHPVISTTGSASVDPAAGGRISLGDEAAIEIPANALGGTGNREIKIAKMAVSPVIPTDLRLISGVYDFSADGDSDYQTSGKVIITLGFDPDLLEDGMIPAVYYYDSDKRAWTGLGGTVSSSSISVQINRFGQLGVFVTEKAAEKPMALTDISGHWAEDNIRELVTLGAVSGYPDYTFKPDNEITRAEFTAIIVKAFDLAPRGGKVFADTVDHWASESIAIAATYEIVNGYDENTFGPDEVITREQMAVMIVKAARLAPEAVELTFEDSDSIAGWAKESMAAAVNHGIISGYPDNNVRPQGHATRAEAVTVIVNAL